MDASRTHEAAQEQSLWMWLVIGVVILGFAVAIAVTLGSNAGDDAVRAPGQVQVQAPAEAPTADYPRHGQGQVAGQIVTGGAFLGAATDIREGGDYAGTAPVGTPDSFTDVRESGSYIGAGTATPHDGRCPVKQGC